MLPSLPQREAASSCWICKECCGSRLWAQHPAPTEGPDAVWRSNAMKQLRQQLLCLSHSSTAASSSPAQCQQKLRHGEDKAEQLSPPPSSFCASWRRLWKRGERHWRCVSQLEMLITQDPAAPSCNSLARGWFLSQQSGSAELPTSPWGLNRNTNPVKTQIGRGKPPGNQWTTDSCS